MFFLILFLLISCILETESFITQKYNLQNKFLKNKIKQQSYFNTKLKMNGLELGVGTFISGIILDTTISKKSLKILIEKNPKELFNGYTKSAVNLLVIGPSLYYLLNLFVLEQSNEVSISKIFLTIVIHSLGYYIGHMSMHKIKYFNSIHSFHHKYKETLLPTIGNSVSYLEFIFVYMLPFVTASLLLHPNSLSLNYAISIISILNLIIHTNELSDISKQLPLWKDDIIVSPYKHGNHHSKKENIPNTYSAPTFNLDNFIEGIFDFKYYLDSIIISIITFIRP